MFMETELVYKFYLGTRETVLFIIIIDMVSECVVHEMNDIRVDTE